MWASDSWKDLAKLIKRMTMLTNSSESALINWPRLSNRHDLDQIEKTARMTGSIVIRVPHTPDLYAESVHPNENGHIRSDKVFEHSRIEVDAGESHQVECRKSKR